MHGNVRERNSVAMKELYLDKFAIVRSGCEITSETSLK